VFGKHRASQVNTSDVEAYKDSRKAEGASNATINRELALLRRAFHLGRENGKIERMPNFKLLAEAKPREGFLTSDRYARLSKACRERGTWLLTFFEVAAQLANRRSELLNLKVSDCDFLGNCLTFRETKNGETRRVPMTASVKTLLQVMCTNKKADDYVFTYSDGTHVTDLRKDWQAVCVAVGEGSYICRKCKEPWTGAKCDKCGEHDLHYRGYRGLLVHDLRRTGVRNMVRRGVSEQVAMKFSGHKTVSVFRRYNITADDDMLDAAKLIENGRKTEARVVEQSATDELQSRVNTGRAQ
jgi:integrase